MKNQPSFFLNNGFADKVEIEKVLKQVQDFYQESKKEGLFVSKEEFIAMNSPEQKTSHSSPKLTSENNLCYTDISWFFESKTFLKLTEHLTKLLGPDIDMVIARVLITLPVCDIPDYVQEIILPVEGKTSGALGPYIKPEWSKASFFAYNPWHNDAIDFPESDCYFMSALFPLTPRNNGKAPLSFVPHITPLGKIPQPFRPSIKENEISFSVKDKLMSFPIETPDVKLQDVLTWHAYTIHNVGLNTSNEPAFSLRFLFNPSHRKNGLRDKGHIRPISRSWVTQITENHQG